MTINCRGISPYEPRFQATIAAIFALAESCGGLRNGSVVDSGAHVGGEACMYADYAPNRIVYEYACFFQGLHVDLSFMHFPLCQRRGGFQERRSFENEVLL